MADRSPEPDEAKIEAWLAGELSDEEAAAVEAQMKAPSSADDNGIDPVVRRELRETRELRSDLTPLVDIVRSRGGSGPPPPGEGWRDVLTPSEDEGLLGTLGDYEVLDVIATGGMGILLKARDPALNRLAALKVLSPNLATNATARERFLREARAAAKLEHENILPIYGVYAEAIPWFAMRYVVGGSLQDVLDEGEAIPVEQLKMVAAQTAAALEAAHAAGIIHRDIKPGNLLLDEDGEHVWVCDFGIAQSTDDPGLTYAGNVAGTPQYMSPEQAEGEELDGRSDLFSLGAVLYHCATHEHAFAGSTTAAVLKNVVEATPRNVTQINRRLPSWLERLIANLLTKDPEDRFATAGDVVRAVEDEYAPRPKHRVRMRRRLFAAAAALASVVLLLQVPAVRESASRSMASALGNKFLIDGHLLSYASLKAAVAAADDGDRILLPGDSPIAIDNLKIPAGRALTFSAAEEGHRPLLTTEIVGAPGISSASPLYLQGLDFKLNPKRDSDGIVRLFGVEGTIEDCSFVSRRDVANPMDDLKARTIDLVDGATIAVEGSRFDLEGTNAFTVLPASYGKTTSAPVHHRHSVVKISNSVVKAFYVLSLLGPVGDGDLVEASAVDSKFNHMSWLKVSGREFPATRILSRGCTFDTDFVLCWIRSQDPGLVRERLRWNGEGDVHPQRRTVVQVSPTSSRSNNATMIGIEEFDLASAPKATAQGTVQVQGEMEVTRDLRAAIENAPNGATLLLEGEFRFTEEFFGPEGRTLHLRAKSPGGAAIVAAHPDRHAMLMRGSTTVEGLRFLRVQSGKYSLPVIGFTGKDVEATVENCRFERVPGRGAGGVGVAFTDCRKAVVRRCVFEMGTGRPVLLAANTKGGSMDVRIEDSVMIGSTAIYRRNRAKVSQKVTFERCIVFGDWLVYDSERNPFYPLDIICNSSIVDMESALLGFPDTSLDAVKERLGWSGRNNRYRAGSHVVLNHRVRRVDEFKGVRITGFDEFTFAVPRAEESGSAVVRLFDPDKLSSPVTAGALAEALLATEVGPAVGVLRELVRPAATASGSGE